jgi:hypothetical protein
VEWEFHHPKVSTSRFLKKIRNEKKEGKGKDLYRYGTERKSESMK